MDSTVVVKGSLLRWVNGPPGSAGVVVEVSAAERIVVRMDSGEQMTFAWPTEALEKLRFEPGSAAQLQADGQTGVVTHVHVSNGLLIYRVTLPSGAQPSVVESGLRPAVITDPIELLRRGEVHNARSTNLRIAATRLSFDHHHNELSSLSNSRVDIKPHQVGVVHRVTSSYPHRFLLADEVGLGKTIEAGLIIKELKARSVAPRVLILAPSGIVSQWQMEMRSKFSLIFSQYSRETVAYLQNSYPGDNVWTLNSNVIASINYAALNENRRREIALAGWDLVVVDEAHHARRRWEGWSRSSKGGAGAATPKYSETNLYKLVEMLADPELGGDPSLLFLTATPMQLHRFELYSLVELLDPALFPSFDEFDEHCTSLAELNRVAEAVRMWSSLPITTKNSSKREIAEWLEQPLTDVEVLLDSASGRARVRDDLYSKHHLSDVLIRNRKSVVGGFTPRVAAVWPVTMTDKEKEAYDAVTEYVRTGYARSKTTRNNALGFLMAVFQKLNCSSSYALRQSLLRRIDRLGTDASQETRTPVVEEEDLEEKPLDVALGGWLGILSDNSVANEVGELARIVHLLDSIEIDTKTRVLTDQLAEIAAEDPDAKVLAFTQFRDTQDYLSKHIKDSWNVTLFHGQMSPAEKDRAVTQFREHAGPQIMISTEAGGEGRNFQFCHILVNYDLPWNPMKIEQRIGRVDRLGQKHPVTVINFSILGTIEERVLDVLARRIRVFEETIGGLDPILGSVENNLKNIFLLASAEAEMALRRFDKDLEARVNAAKKTESQLADLIMDTKSFRQDEVHALLKHRSSVDNDTMKRFILGALAEMGVRIERDPDIPDVYVLEFRGGFATEFPQLVREGVSRRVTFSPSAALDYETIDFLAFGHEIVEALVGRVLSKEYGALASHRYIKTDEQEPSLGWFFTYVLRFEGVVSHEELFTVFIDGEGAPNHEMATWLLNRSLRLKREEWGPVNLPLLDETFESAVELANELAVQRLIEQHVVLSATNDERLNQERAKLERYYQYRESVAIEKLESVQIIFQRISESGDPDVQRIIPVWSKNLENAKRVKESVSAERDRRLAELANREQVTAQHEIFSASYIEIVTEAS